VTPGRYRLQMIDVWLNSQVAGGINNPMHTHAWLLSPCDLPLKVRAQIHNDSFDGSSVFTAPSEWHIQELFRTAMAPIHCAGGRRKLDVFPAWQPHFGAALFRGERASAWSLAIQRGGRANAAQPCWAAPAAATQYSPSPARATPAAGFA